MNAGVRRDLDEAVAEFWRSSPWQTLSDEEHFGVRDSQSGLLACCVVMGHAGLEYGLGLYLGQEGFGVSRRQRTSMMDVDEFAYEADFILVSYNDAGKLEKSQRKGMVALSSINHAGRKVIPLAWRKVPHATARPLDDAEAGFVVRALRAIIELLQSKRLGGGRLRDPDDVLVFVLPASPGSPVLEEHLKVQPAPVVAKPRLLLSSATRTKLAAVSSSGTIAVAFSTPSMSVQDEQVRMLIVLDVEDDAVLAGQAFMGPDALQQAGQYFVSAMLGEAIIEHRVPLPAELVTDSREFYQHVKDAISDLGVRVLYQEHVPHLEHVKASFSDFMKRKD